MPRRPNILYFVLLGLAFSIGALIVSATIDDRSAQAPLDVPAAPTPTPAPIPSPTPEPTAMPTPEPTETPSGPPDRASCAEITGTVYRSDSERDWFLANCTGP